MQHLATNPRIITSARIELPRSWGDMAKVMVQVDRGEERQLFDYFADELRFEADEFIGLSETEGRKLHYQRDLQYIRGGR